MQEIELPQHKKYKGSIRWFKLYFKSGICKIEKRRPFGNDSYRIPSEDYHWITDAKKAEAIWTFCHYHGTATWYSGQLKHPRTGEGYVKAGAA